MTRLQEWEVKRCVVVMLYVDDVLLVGRDRFSSV